MTHLRCNDALPATWTARLQHEWTQTLLGRGGPRGIRSHYGFTKDVPPVEITEPVELEKALTTVHNLEDWQILFIFLALKCSRKPWEALTNTPVIKTATQRPPRAPKVECLVFPHLIFPRVGEFPTVLISNLWGSPQ